MSDHAASDVEVAQGLECPEVCTKYRVAADIANLALKAVLAAVEEGADVFTLCKLGDDTIEAETAKVYNKRVKGDDKKKDGKTSSDKKMDKGVGFPTCISINEVAGHFSPLKNESRIVQGGDLVKVDLGVQIDGFIAQAGHTVYVPVADGEKANDRRADVVKAAYTAAEAVLRLMQPGKTNTEVTKTIQQVADEFKCQPVHGVLSHELKQHVIDGQNCIISKESLNDEQKVEEFEFGLNTAFTIDIVMSTGDGKTREVECRHTVYKRAVENSYILKTAKARQFISEVGRRFPTLPFSLRLVEDEQCARVGVSEAKRHNLLHEYPVLAERAGEFVAQFKFTVLLLPGGTKKITGLPFDQEAVLESSMSVENAELKDLLAKSAAPRKKRANKAKKAAAGEAEA